MPTIPTIQVFWPKKGEGTFQINEEDFDPKVHKKLSEAQEAKAEKAAEAAKETKK